MKVTTQDYDEIRFSCRLVLKTLSWTPPRLGMIEVWDIFHLAARRGYLSINELYSAYNDDNLETALRRIFKKELAA